MRRHGAVAHRREIAELGRQHQAEEAVKTAMWFARAKRFHQEGRRYIIAFDSRVWRILGLSKNGAIVEPTNYVAVPKAQPSEFQDNLIAFRNVRGKFLIGLTNDGREIWR